MTVEGVRKVAADVALFVVSRPGDRFAAIERPAEVSGLPVVRAGREIDPQLLRSAELGFRNGHVPVTGVISAIAVLAAVLDERDVVVMSNEWSASVPTLEYRGEPVNHQYSKSAAFEAAFRDVLAADPAGLPGYFSALRDRTELWVGDKLAALTEYHATFRSCNKAFIIDPARRLDHWCGTCDKCCFIDLILAPFMSAEQLRAVFAADGGGGEPLDNPELEPKFECAARLGHQAVRVRRRGQRVPRGGRPRRPAGRPGRDPAPAEARGGDKRPARRADRSRDRGHAPPGRRELRAGRPGRRVVLTRHGNRNQRPQSNQRPNQRPTLGWSDLRGARVGVWGLGREGSASLRKLARTRRRAGPGRRQPNRAGVSERPPTAAWTPWPRCEIVIKTPGISPYGPEATGLRQAGVTLVGGLGLWLQEADRDRVVCVTGTKGKSTTSSIIGHLLTGLGYRALVGGNFGAAPYDPQHAGDYDYWVIEVSSYTATDLASTPPVTAVTSLHPDHLPWHGGVEQYYRDKLSACSQPGAELTVANGDSALLRERAGLLAPKVEWVCERDEPGATWMDPLGLPGGHNRRNALIARRVLSALGHAAGDKRLADAVRRRRGPAQRRGRLHPAAVPPHHRRHGRRGRVRRRLAVHQRAADAGRARRLPRPPGRAHRRRPGPRHRLRPAGGGRPRANRPDPSAHPPRQRPQDHRRLRRGSRPRPTKASPAPPTAPTSSQPWRRPSPGPARTAASCSSRPPPPASAASATTATEATSSPPPCAPAPPPRPPVIPKA